MAPPRSGDLILDTDRLRADLARVAWWSQPSRYEQTGVHHGYRRALNLAGLFEWVLEGFAPVVWAQVAVVDPGGFIAPHVDAGPYMERWHVPIVAAGVFQQGDDTFEPVAGVPFRVRHWERHAVWNPTDTGRVHLMIDRNVVAAPKATFELFPVPSCYEHMIPSR